MAEILKGTVTSLNDNGFKLDGGEDWVNFSIQHFKGVKPERGDRITASCSVGNNGKYWANEIKVLQGSAGANGAGGGLSTNESIQRQVALKGAIDMAVANLGAVVAGGDKGDFLTWTIDPKNVMNVATQLLAFFAVADEEPEPEYEPAEDAP